MYSDISLSNRSRSSDDIKFYCVICRISLTSRSAWTLHVNGHHHDSSSIPAAYYRSASTVVEELICKTVRLLGSQLKFVVRVGKKNIFKFQCLLCLVELNGYFAVVEHLDNSGHQSRVDRVDLDGNSSIMSAPNAQKEAGEFSKAVALFCKFYSGSLTCNRCSQKVELDEKQIITHEDKFHSRIIVHEEKTNSSSIVEKFLRFLEAESVNEEAYPKLDFDVLRARIESLQSNSADLIVSSFQCVDCDVAGSIDKWEPHVLSRHIKEWDLSLSNASKNEYDFEDENRDILCLCLQCECIFFGRRETIAQHPHFENDRLPNDFPSLKPTPFTKFLCKFNRYRVQRGPYAPYVAYCDPCQYFAFEKLEKHFATQDHQLKTHIACDWYECRICRIVFFGERRLYCIHKLWPAHIRTERKAKTDDDEMFSRARHDVEIHDRTRWTETNEHVTLLKRLQEKIEGELKSSYQFCNNFQQFAYYCDVCGITKDSKIDWSYHLRDETHEANAMRVAKVFENTCVSCKLCIFGGIGCHVEHSKTKGHNAIKKTVLILWNQERVRNKVELTSNCRMNEQRLSEILYAILESQNRPNSSLSESETRKPCKTSSKDEKAPSVEKLPEPFVEKTVCKLKTLEPAADQTCKASSKDAKTSLVQKNSQQVVEKTSSLPSSSEPKILSQTVKKMLKESCSNTGTSVKHKRSQSMTEQSEEPLVSGVHSYKIDIRNDPITIRETIRAFLLESEERCQSDHLKRFHCTFCIKYYGKVDSWWKHLAEPKHIGVVKSYFKGSSTSIVNIFHCTGCNTITFGTTKSDHDYRKCSLFVENKRRSVSRTSEDHSSTRSFSSSSSDFQTEATSTILLSETKIRQVPIELSTKPSSGDVYTCIIDIRDEQTKIHDKIKTFINESEKRRKKERFERLNCSFCKKSHGTVRTWCNHLRNEMHVEMVRKFFEGNAKAYATVFHCNECDTLSFSHTMDYCHHNSCSQWVPKEMRTSKTSGDLSRSISSSPSSSSDIKTELLDETEAMHRVGSDSMPEVTDNNEDEDEEEDLEETMKNEDLSEDVSSISDGSEDERNENEEERINGDKVEYVKHLIVVRGIPADNLKNKKLIQNTFRKYGNVNRTYAKKNISDTLFLVVIDEPEEMLQNLKENVDELKMKLNAEELIIENETRSCDGPGTRDYLSEKAVMLFSNHDELNNAIRFLMKKYEEERTSVESRARVQTLVSVVQDLAIDMYERRVFVKAYVFGSRYTGLASENSDVDIYLQIANSFRGATQDSSNLQRELVLYFAHKMRMLPQKFSNVTSISLARVPIVKFTHVQSNLNCDLSFKSGLSTMNSILVRIYLELDDRVKVLICGVKLWMKLNEIASSNLFTTYAQIWMVLFFLMQANISVVPTVIAMRRMLPPNQQEFLIEGWNTAFPKAKSIIWRSVCKMSVNELLYKFFEFYSDENLEKYVLCTMTGMKMEKKHFIQLYEQLPKIWFNQFTSRMKFDRLARRRITNDFEGLCVQDPFDHAHNVTKTINGRKYKCFVEMCRKTTAILKK